MTATQAPEVGRAPKRRALARRAVGEPRSGAFRPAAPPESAPAPHRSWTLTAVVGAVLVAAVVLRFWTRSDMWLDEAQTVSIARLPLSRIPAALRHDGSPPLYYFLLHLWMRAFGTSNLAVRSVSGVLGTATLPLAWLAGRRLKAAGPATLLLATSPFAVRYSTENRMYMLIVVLVLLGYLSLSSALNRPRPLRLAAVSVVTGLMLLTHYWGFYLVAAVILLLAWMSVHPGPGVPRRNARWALGAVVAGGGLFIPWASSFLYQLHHTGTPWAPSVRFGDLGVTISDFGGIGTALGRLLGLALFGLALFGLFGRAVDRTHVEFDLRGRPAARPLGFVFAATLLLAVTLSYAFGGAYSARYTSVVLVPFLLLVALGVATLTDRRARAAVLTVVAAAGLAGAAQNVYTERTQAGQVAAAVETRALPGDAVVYCPDQLAPAVNRLLPPGRFRQFTYPAAGNPAVVDWVGYAARIEASHPAAFAAAVVSRIPVSANVWLVWSPDYPTVGTKCAALLQDFIALRPAAHQVFGQDPTYYEHEFLDYFAAG